MLADRGRWRVPVALAAGCLAAPLFTAVPPVGVLAAMATAGLSLLWMPSLRPLGVLLLACCWSLWHYQVRLEQRLAPQLAGQLRTVTGTVHSIPQRYDDYTRFIFRPEPSQDPAAALPPRILVRWFQQRPLLSAGQRWRLELRLKPPWAPVNFQGPDGERGYFANGVGAVATVRKGERLDPGPRQAARLTALREGILRAVGRQVEAPRQRGLVQALAVADRSGLSRGDRQLLSLTGTAHLLAISGLHIGLAAAGGGALVRGLAWLWPGAPAGRVLHALTVAGAILTAGAYAALAGFGTSTVRALLMLLAVLTATLAGRAPHPARAWLLALCAVLLLDPFAPLRAGFWFSFLAVAALLLVFVPRPGPRRWWRTLLMAQGGVMLVTLPVGAAWFQTVSSVSYLANLVAIPLVSLAVVPAVLAGVAVLGVSETLAGICWAVAGGAGAVLMVFLEQVAALPGSPVAVSAPTLATGLLATAGACLLLLPRGLPFRWTGAFLLVPLFLPVKSDVAAQDIELEVLDVGQGTAALVRSGGRTLLYDTGPGDGAEANLVARVILPALYRRGQRPPDRMLISHGDLDHAGGLQTLRRAFPSTGLWANLSPSTPSGPAGAAMARRCSRPLLWHWDRTRFEVLHPSPGLPYLGNDSSCVLSVSGPGGRLLLPGDISENVERRLLLLSRRRYDLLLVPHHGSETSSHPAFVHATKPRVAVVTAGLGNRFGFPRGAVRRRYEDAGGRFWSTGDCGALRIVLRGDGRLQAWSARRLRQGLWRWPASPGCPNASAEP